MSPEKAKGVNFNGSILSVRDGKLTVNGLESTYSEGERITGIHHKTLSFRVRNLDKSNPEYIQRVLSTKKLNAAIREKVVFGSAEVLSNEWLRTKI